MPVYGAAEELAACLASLERHTDLHRHRLVVVDDAGPGFDPAPLAALAARLAAAAPPAGAGADSGVLLLRNPERRGLRGQRQPRHGGCRSATSSCSTATRR